jgi:hypothetical protein
VNRPFRVLEKLRDILFRMQNESSGWRAGLLPPIKLPLLYLAFASICFTLALLGVIFYARDLTGFYYHPHILAITHLITLGWISGNILGTLYIVGPMSLQVYLPARVYDAIAFLLYIVGVSGMVAHFWRSLPVGMAWSAGCVYLGILLVGFKVLRSIRPAKTPGYVKLHIVFAFMNLFAGGAWGLLVAFHKVYGFLPTSSYPNVIAHAHLAAIGWGTMMVFGIAYRLLPMFLPAEPVKTSLPWISAILIETGIAGFFLFTLVESFLRILFAGLIAAGILLFFVSAIRIVRRRKPAPPPEIPRPDFSMLHAPFAFLSLIAAVVLGFILFYLPQNEKTLQWAFAYGVLGLVGFLSQIVIGFKPKILSVFTWYHAFSRYGANVPRPVDMPIRTFQISVFGLWVIGLPLLISGLVRSASYPIQAGATLLFTALLIAVIHEITILRIIWRLK